MKGYFSFLWAIFEDLNLLGMGLTVLAGQVILAATLGTLQIDFNSHTISLTFT